MSRVVKVASSHGSLKDIQLLVNDKPHIIDGLIKSAFPDLIGEEIIWVSPLQSDDYAEYSDDDFLKIVELYPDEIKLKEFWPTKGPQWDALANTSSGKVILVEAKANIPEIVTSASAAREVSKKLIDQSLAETKAFLNIKNEIDWSGKFYQYTNRLAHLYFLREKRKKSVYLVNIYFIGDTTVLGPNTQDEWIGALKVLYSYLGLSRHKLSKYMADVFVDFKSL